MALSCLLVSLLSHSETYDLAWKAVKGRAVVYGFSVEGKDAQVAGSVEAVIERKVVEVKDGGGYKVLSRVLGSTVRIAGSEIKDDRQHESSARFEPNGGLVSVSGEGEKAEQYRHALLTQFVRPMKKIKVGDSWNFSFEKKGVEGLGKVSVQYTLVAAEGGEATVKFVFIEAETKAGQKAGGTWRVNVGSGEIEGMEAKVTNYSGAIGSVANVKLVRRIESAPKSRV